LRVTVLGSPVPPQATRRRGNPRKPISFLFIELPKLNKDLID